MTGIETELVDHHHHQEAAPEIIEIETMDEAETILMREITEEMTETGETTEIETETETTEEIEDKDLQRNNMESLNCRMKIFTSSQ